MRSVLTILTEKTEMLICLGKGFNKKVDVRSVLKETSSNITKKTAHDDDI